MECEKLTSILIPENVKVIKSLAFLNCLSLTDLTIQDGEVDIVIESYSFKGCSMLKTVKWTNRVEDIGEMAFGDCESLTEILIPDSIIVIRSKTFTGCLNLKKVIIPDSVVYIEDYAFNNCPLPYISISKSTILAGDAFNKRCKVYRN